MRFYRELEKWGNMPELSILLPSLRPLEVEKRIAEFAKTDPDVDYEIIIVSPFPVSGEKVAHLLETEKKGVLFAMNEAYKKASGEYVIPWSDDAAPRENCLQNILSFVKSQNPEIPFVAGFAKESPRGAGFGQWQVYGKLYAGWLCASKKTIERAGGLFDTVYKNYWGDPDFCLRVWEKGGRVEICKNAVIKIGQIDDEIKSSNLNSCFEHDTETFFNRWHDKLGGRSKKVWWLINCEVPNCFSDHVRAFLRHIPYLKLLKDNAISATRKFKTG